MVIEIVKIVPGADTADQGSAVLAALREALNTDQEVEVSFQGIKTATSSFVGTSFVQLLESIPFDEIKKRIRVVQSTRQINEMIKFSMERRTRTI